ncbi:hypothetical protein Plhal304r1_c001g0001801 [Plasmopara halstedii]
MLKKVGQSRFFRPVCNQTSALFLTLYIRSVHGCLVSDRLVGMIDKCSKINCSGQSQGNLNTNILLIGMGKWPKMRNVRRSQFRVKYGLFVA